MADVMKDILSKINKSFKIRRPVDFDDLGIHLEMEPLTSLEEVKVIESCTDLDGAEYLETLKRASLAYAIKRINEHTFEDSDMTVEDEAGELVTKSKFLVLREFIGKWPTAFINSIFDSYSNILEEAADIAKKNMRFETYQVTDPPDVSKEEEAEGAPSGMKVVKKPAAEEPETETDKLNQAVKKEIDEADAALAASEADAQV